MVIGNAIMAVSVTLLYVVTPMIPTEAVALRYVAFILLYAIWVIGYTFQTSVTRAAQPVLTNDPKQRPLFTIFNTIGSLAGMGVMQALAPIVASNGMAGDYNAAWFVIMTPIGIALSVLCTIRLGTLFPDTLQAVLASCCICGLFGVILILLFLGELGGMGKT